MLCAWWLRTSEIYSHGPKSPKSKCQLRLLLKLPVVPAGTWYAVACRHSTAASPVSSRGLLIRTPVLGFKVPLIQYDLTLADYIYEDYFQMRSQPELLGGHELGENVI